MRMNAAWFSYTGYAQLLRTIPLGTVTMHPVYRQFKQ